MITAAAPGVITHLRTRLATMKGRT
jgi:hypothetical protein